MYIWRSRYRHPELEGIIQRVPTAPPEDGSRQYRANGTFRQSEYPTRNQVLPCRHAQPHIVHTGDEQADRQWREKVVRGIRSQDILQGWRSREYEQKD